uniref:Uncharacterized protein n=1 Tax=Cacopsylla melanoneura TaxID=428564 RepID=A0A8D8XDS9_9HEMI
MTSSARQHFPSPQHTPTRHVISPPLSFSRAGVGRGENPTLSITRHFSPPSRIENPPFHTPCAPKSLPPPTPLWCYFSFLFKTQLPPVSLWQQIPSLCPRFSRESLCFFTPTSVFCYP